MSMYGSDPPAGVPVFLLTVDVEDWFQVENFKGCIPFSSWAICESRVERNTHRLLDLFDSSTQTRVQKPLSSGQSGSSRSSQSSGAARFAPCGVKATFFILGWVAKRLPALVREIHSRGHEIASHGFFHNLCGEQTSPQIREDLKTSKKILEDIVGTRVFGYRAPSFSINDEVLGIVEECGYAYDSSFNSFNLQGRYGTIRVSLNGKRGIAVPISPGFFELPISNLRTWGTTLPWGGGGYFRLIPSVLFRAGVRRNLRNEGAFLFYIHPWEIDPDQPRVNEAPAFFRFRHYHNLNKAHEKLGKLIFALRYGRFLTCRRYLEEVDQNGPAR